LAKSALDYLYHTQRWKNVRSIHLKRFPNCARCAGLGRIRAASIVDHDPPCGDSVAAFWDPQRYRSLCRKCHDFCRREQRLGYSTAIGVDGRPIDPKHPANAVRAHTLPPIDDPNLSVPSDLCVRPPREPKPPAPSYLPKHIQEFLGRKWKRNPS
jgi:hypothetical protein